MPTVSLCIEDALLTFYRSVEQDALKKLMNTEKCTILLVRHGETESNRENRFQGQLDIPLNDTGKQQAFLLRNGLQKAKIDAVYSSPLSRAKETAEIIIEPHKNAPFTLVDYLKEIHHGEWQGCLASDLSKRYSNEYLLWQQNPIACRKPGGETLTELQARVIPAWNKIIQNSDRRCLARFDITRCNRKKSFRSKS